METGTAEFLVYYSGCNTAEFTSGIEPETKCPAYIDFIILTFVSLPGPVCHSGYEAGVFVLWPIIIVVLQIWDDAMCDDVVDVMRNAGPHIYCTRIPFDSIGFQYQRAAIGFGSKHFQEMHIAQKSQVGPGRV